MKESEYSELLKQAKAERKKKLATGALFKFLSDAANAWGGNRISNDYSGVIAAADRPISELEKRRSRYIAAQRLKREQEKHDSAIENVSSVIEDRKTKSERDSEKHKYVVSNLKSTIKERNQRAKRNEKKTEREAYKYDPSHDLADKARKDARARGIDVPDHADINYFLTGKGLGLDVSLPVLNTQTTVYDKNNKPSVIVYDKNRPDNRTHVGDGKREIQTDSYGNKRLAGSDRNIDFRPENQGYANSISDIQSPALRERAEKYIESSFKANKRFNILKSQEDSILNIESMAKEARRNPYAASSLIFTILRAAGNVGAVSDSDVRLMAGSNDYANWLDRTSTNFLDKKSITEQDFEDVINYVKSIKEEISRKRNSIVNDAASRLKVQVPELSNSGVDSTISAYYGESLPSLDSDMPEGYSRYGHLEDYPEYKMLKPGQEISYGGQTFLIGKNGDIYERKG